MLKNIVSDEFSKSFERLLRRIPIHPNIITLLSVIAATGGYYIYDYSRWYAVALFLLAIFIEILDGIVAKAKYMETRKGAFIDGILDKIVEFIIILTIFNKITLPDFILDKQMMLLAVLFFGTCMTSFVKAYAEHSQIVGHMKAVKMPGIVERAERIILLTIIFVLGIIGSKYASPLLLFTAALSFATFIERVIRVLISKD